MRIVLLRDKDIANKIYTRIRYTSCVESIEYMVLSLSHFAKYKQSSRKKPDVKSN